VTDSPYTGRSISVWQNFVLNSFGVRAISSAKLLLQINFQISPDVDSCRVMSLLVGSSLSRDSVPTKKITNFYFYIIT